MKKIILILSIVSTSFATAGQNKDTVQAYIEGYKITDTIRIEDLLRIGGISLNNNQFSIESFSLIFMDRGFLQEFKTTSNKLTDEMKNALTNLKNKNIKSVKILFENIIVRTPQNTKSNIGMLIYKLKL